MLDDWNRGRKAISEYAAGAAAMNTSGIRESTIARGDIEEVEVPQQLIDVLAHNMPRFLQLVHHWSDKTGSLDALGFERLLFTLGVRDSVTAVKSLFSVIDSDSSGKISLSELLLLKFAIDNDIHALPSSEFVDADDQNQDWSRRQSAWSRRQSTMSNAGRDSRESGRDSRMSRQSRASAPRLSSGKQQKVMKLADHHKIQDSFMSDFGLFGLAKPLLGAVWKGVLRPHHTLDMVPGGLQRKPQISARVTVNLRVRSVGPKILGKSILTPRVKLELGTTLRRQTRERFRYVAGPVGDTMTFLTDMQAKLSAAADEACVEEGALLHELRQMDLKLEEVKLHQMEELLSAAPEKKAEEQQKAQRVHELEKYLKQVLSDFANDAESALISHTRYRTDRDAKPPPELVGMPRAGVLTIDEVLARDENRDVFFYKALSALSCVLLVVTLCAYIGVFVGIGRRGTGDSWYDNHDVCEFQKFACEERSWQYVCDPINRTVLLRAEYTNLDGNTGGTITSGSGNVYHLAPPLDWGEPLLGKVCDEDIRRRSWCFALPLPFLFLAAVVLPIGLFRKNAHMTTVKKCILWTPTVPLVVLQCLLRAAVLLSVIPTAADKVHAAIMGAEALILVAQVAVFVMMDAMRIPTPVLRIGFALALIMRFGASVRSRSFSQISAEQVPLLRSGYWRDQFMGLGSASKQSTISSVDWTIVFMLFSSVLSVINYPGEMAVVRLRCDTRGYFNWRDQYIGAMAVRSHRRDLGVADNYLKLRSAMHRKWLSFRRWKRGKKWSETARKTRRTQVHARDRGLDEMSRNSSYVVRNIGFMARGGFGFMRQRREKQRASKNACAYVDASQEGCSGSFLPGVIGHEASGGASEQIEEGRSHSVEHAVGLDAHLPVSARVRENPYEPLRPSVTFIDPATGETVKTARI